MSATFVVRSNYNCFGLSAGDETHDRMRAAFEELIRGRRESTDEPITGAQVDDFAEEKISAHHTQGAAPSQVAQEEEGGSLPPPLEDIDAAVAPPPQEQPRQIDTVVCAFAAPPTSTTDDLDEVD